jgi:dCMP deaminase
LREHLGAGVLAHRILRRLESDVNAVIDSIRNPAEVEALRATGHFRLIRVDALAETRFERIRRRDREGDPADLESFQALELREARGNAHSQNLQAVGEMADCAIANDGTLEELRSGVDALLLRLLKELPRPGWDQYFMDIARVAASRSNCLKRKVAAIIVREKRIISTGYNGTPRGTKNCNEGGCGRCNDLAASGTHLDECLCSHGEENAIVQAAYHGVGLSGSTIYSTFAPCLMCAKMIINSGIAEVVYNRDYPLNDSAFRLFREAGVEVRRMPLSER